MQLLPDWAEPWLEFIELGLQIVLIVFGAWVLNLLFRRLVRRLASSYSLPAELVMGARRVVGLVVYAGAILMILDRFQVRPEETIYIGDSEIDREHCAGVGVDLIAFRNSALPARYHVDSFMAITALEPFQRAGNG